MATHSRGFVALLGGMLLLGACRDSTTTLPEVEAGRPGPALALAGAPATPVGDPASPYACLTSVATPAGRHPYRYGRIDLRFRGEALHPAGATFRYRYRLVASDGRVLRVANCVIPRSIEAVEQVGRVLRVPGSAVPSARGRMGEEVHLQGCVDKGECALEPLVIGLPEPTDQQPEEEEPDPCPGGTVDSWGWCTYSPPGGPGGSPGSGGGDSDPGDPEAEDDGTGRPPCKRDANGNCITLTSAEWDRLLAAIEKIKEVSAECTGAKNALRGLAAQGHDAQRFRFWDGYDKYIDPATGDTIQRYGQNLSDAGGRYIEYDSYWVWNDPFLVVHEGLHLYLYLINSTLMGNANETWVRATARTCV